MFWALTPGYAWDLENNVIIVICNETPIFMYKFYNNMYANKTDIQSNEVLSFQFGSV